MSLELGAVAQKVDELENRIEDVVVALGYVRDRTEANGEERRTLREDVAALKASVAELESTTRELAKDVNAIGTNVRVMRRKSAEADGKHAEQLGAVLAEVSETKQLLGRWPSSPDDMGSGLAGRVALASLPDRTPNGEKPSTVPPAALVALWKKNRRLAALLVTLLALVLAAIESGAIRFGH